MTKITKTNSYPFLKKPDYSFLQVLVKIMVETRKIFEVPEVPLELLEKMAAKLPHHDALCLRYGLDNNGKIRNHKEVAELLGVKVGTSEAWIAHARLGLRFAIEAWQRKQLHTPEKALEIVRRAIMSYASKTTAIYIPDDLLPWLKQSLNQSEFDILDLRFGLGEKGKYFHTLEAIGSRTGGLTREGVSQKVNKIFRKLVSLLTK